MVQSLNGVACAWSWTWSTTTRRAPGQQPPSVLDRIVPGYYHRLNADGAVQTSTCCANTASEHAMMEKLIVDSVLSWATRLQGGRLPLRPDGPPHGAQHGSARAALDALTPARDGVDGRAIYVYGEGWDFGEVAGNARGVNATQRNLAGTGIGTFNDRLRDAVRGGTPFAGHRDQGFATGAVLDPNGTDQATPDAQRARCSTAHRPDQGRARGQPRRVHVRGPHRRTRTRSGRELPDAPAGYTADPQEAINYVEAHDNETLFDAIQAKAAATTPLAQRVRMQMLGISLTALAQGVPFFHAGMELLRSKSMDRNSYDSGDWFNRLDYTYTSNTWGVGLPPERENRAHWPRHRPAAGQRRASARARPRSRRRSRTSQEVLQMRRSSPLFRLRIGRGGADAPALPQRRARSRCPA